MGIRTLGIAGFGNVLKCTWLAQGQICVQVCRTFNATPTHSMTVLAIREGGGKGEGQPTCWEKDKDKLFLPGSLALSKGSVRGH